MFELSLSPLDRVSAEICNFTHQLHRCGFKNVERALPFLIALKKINPSGNFYFLDNGSHVTIVTRRFAMANQIKTLLRDVNVALLFSNVQYGIFVQFGVGMDKEPNQIVIKIAKQNKLISAVENESMIMSKKLSLNTAVFPNSVCAQILNRACKFYNLDAAINENVSALSVEFDYKPTEFNSTGLYEDMKNFPIGFNKKICVVMYESYNYGTEVIVMQKNQNVD
jgi:hypothetical protein